MLSDLLQYGALIVRVTGIIKATLDNADGEESQAEAFARRAHELAGLIHDNAAAGVAYDENLAARVNTLADEYEAHGGRKSQTQWLQFMDDTADTAQRFRSKLKLRIAEQSA
ncbi:MAG: hypothetical protein AAFY47_05315 [Pseudomonadota bacterium]